MVPELHDGRVDGARRPSHLGRGVPWLVSRALDLLFRRLFLARVANFGYEQLGVWSF